MAIFNTESSMFRYVCNIKFSLYFCICILVVIAITYFVVDDFSPWSQNPSNTNENNDENKYENLNKNVEHSVHQYNWQDNEEIRIFREYLKIATVHPDIDYQPAVDFLERQAANLDLSFDVHYPVDQQNPVVVMTWKGLEPELPSIMLNSHMDVVPVYEEYWTYPPFAAEMEDNGNIYARGAQDMKCVGTWYLAAIRELKRLGVKRLKRTIHLTYVPDEELGGTRGMKGFVESDAFREMNVAFALDERGGGSKEFELPAYYYEKLIWQIELIFHGASGHASKFLQNTPGEKLNYVLGKMTQYSQEEMNKLNELKYSLGNVTSINLTILKGGIQSNVVPATMSATFDMRISINTDVNEFEQMIMRWCEEAGGDILIKTVYIGAKQIPTRVDDSNPFWVAFKTATMHAGLVVEPSVLGGSTDMKYLRAMNISAIGFTPLVNTIPRQHDHDEYLNADTYLNGIHTYVKIISSLGNS